MPELDIDESANLQHKEEKLRVRELELKVKDLEKPSYKRISYWTSIVTVLIAVVGIIAQSFLSNIKYERAALEREQADTARDASLRQKQIADHEFQIVQVRKTTAQKQLDSVLIVYNQILRDAAYRTVDTSNNQQQATTQKLITKSNETLSNILLSNTTDQLLKNSILKIYYLPSTKMQAERLNQFLTEHGVTSSFEAPGYSIQDVSKNEIVYYNDPQLPYCKAVKSLLESNGWGPFGIRLSSGATATIHYFKIYLVK